MSMLPRLSAGLNKLAQWLMIGLMSVMLVVTGGQVTLRYLFNESLAWSQELVSYIFVWVAFMGGSIAFYRGTHLAVDLLAPALDRTRRVVKILYAAILHGAVLFALGFLVLYGVTLCIANSATDSIVMQLNMAIPYAAVPLASAFMFVHQLARIADAISGRRDPGVASPADAGREPGVLA